MSDGTNTNQQGNSLVDDPINESESTIQYSHLIQERVFIGTYPFITILEGIRKQFEDYINIDDVHNYVDVFFTQLQKSYDSINLNDAEEHPTEKREALDRIYNEFISTIAELFDNRLTLTIMDIENGSINDPDLEFIIRRLYEFFILNARNNFKVVIASDIIPKIKDIGDNDSEYFRAINESMDTYSPLISSITPTQFLQYRGDQEVYDLFDNGRVCGNFLRKYSPKLYQNEEFQVDLINYITMVQQFKKDIINK